MIVASETDFAIVIDLYDFVYYEVTFSCYPSVDFIFYSVVQKYIVIHAYLIVVYTFI